jgi:hypothetical protein
MSAIEELLDRKCRDSSLENRDYGYKGSAALAMLYLQKLAPTLPTSGGRSVGIVRSRTQAMTQFS